MTAKGFQELKDADKRLKHSPQFREAFGTAVKSIPWLPWDPRSRIEGSTKSNVQWTISPVWAEEENFERENSAIWGHERDANTGFMILNKLRRYPELGYDGDSYYYRNYIKARFKLPKLLSEDVDNRRTCGCSHNSPREIRRKRRAHNAQNLISNLSDEVRRKSSFKSY